MKQKITLLITLLLFSISAAASHLRGGEILVKQGGNLKVNGQLVLYRNTGGVNQVSATINFGDGKSSTVTLTSSILLNSGTEKYFFNFSHTYTSTGVYTISFTENYRNDGILNINNGSSGQVPISFYSTIKVYSTTPAARSTFKFPASGYNLGQKGRQFSYYAGGYDTDSDSVLYSLVAPMQSASASVPGYKFPDRVGGGSLTIDKYSGLVTLDSPATVGLYALAVLVEKFKNGEKVSSTLRDIQLAVYQPTSDIFSDGYYSNISDSSGYHLHLGDTLSVTLTATGFSSTYNKFSINSELLDLAKNISIDTSIVRIGAGSAVINFQVVPDSTWYREKPYIVNIHFDSNVPEYFSKDYAFKIYVKDPNAKPTAVQREVYPFKLSAYPNPTENEWKIWNPGVKTTLYVWAADTHISFYCTLLPGENRIDVGHLPPGLYIYRAGSHSGKLLKQ